MTAMNNLLTLRLDLGSASSPISYLSGSPVVPNNKTITAEQLERTFSELLAGKLVNSTLRCDVGPVAASDVCTIVTSADTGTYRTTINGVNVDATGTGTISTTCAAIALAINSSTDPLVKHFVTATAGSATVTVTAAESCIGLPGNAITIAVSGTNYSSANARLVGGLDSYAAVSAAAASGLLTISSGSGVITAYIAGHAVAVTWASSDDNTGDLLVAAIKADTAVNNMVTASNTSGAVTISAKSTGAWGNTISLSGAGTGVTVTLTTLGYLAGGADPTIGYAEVTGAQASQTDTISGSDSGTYTVVVGGITATATGTSNDTTTGDAIVTAILASSLAQYVTASNASGVVTVTALENGPWAGTLGNVVPFSVTGTGATAGDTTLLGGLAPVTCRWPY